MKKPFLSIIIVCYNYGHLVKKTLEAIANQDYKDYEIVFVNNASTDNSLDVLNEFMEKHKDIDVNLVNIKVNEGPIKGYNRGLHEARGEYFLYNDADDWIEPNALKILCNKAKKTRADIIAGLFQEVNPGGEIVRKRKFSKNPTKWAIPMLQGVIFKRELVEKYGIGFNKDVKSGDLYLIMQFCCVSKNVEFIPKVLHNYLLNPVSVTAKKDDTWHKGSVGWQPKKEMLAMIDYCYELIETAHDKDAYMELEYWVTKKVYEFAFIVFNTFKYKIAMKEYRNVLNYMEKKFPNYKKNKNIMFRNNGYTFFARGCVKMLNVVNRLNLWGLVGRIISLKTPSKYIVVKK